jgi:hypothetical protein
MVDEPAGDAEQAPPQGGLGLWGGVFESQQRHPAGEVGGQRGDHTPGAVGGVVAAWQVAQRAVFVVADGELDDGMLAVLALDHGEGFCAVGDEREVTPVGPERGLRADQPGAAYDQAPPCQACFGDLREARVRVVARDAVPSL